ncbi:MAG: hypothetical protein F8N36_07570 [Desulfovibrio sp.]|nr:hypothetical protein [Desulfovibrio sp.]
MLSPLLAKDKHFCWHAVARTGRNCKEIRQQYSDWLPSGVRLAWYGVFEKLSSGGWLQRMQLEALNDLNYAPSEFNFLCNIRLL